MAAVRIQRVILSAAIIGTSSLAIARASGWPRPDLRLGTPAIDLWSAVWAPVRGVVQGYNVYADHSAYTDAFGVPYGASAHPPFTWGLLSPLAALPLHQAWLLFMIASCACVWASVWILVAPATPKQELGVAITGALLVCGAAVEFLLDVGQLTGLAVLGVALVVRYPSGWRGLLGVVLMATVPQTAIPLSILLLRGRARTVLRGWIVAAMLSIPPLVAVCIATGQVGPVMRSVLSTLGRPATSAPSRIDVVGMVLGHDALFALLFLALAGLVVWLRGQPITHRDRVAVLVVVTATTTLWYHRPYDLVLPGVALAALTVKSGVPADRLLFAVFVAAGVFSSGLAGEWRSAWTGLSMKSSWALVSACVPVIILGWLAIARVMSEFSARTSPALEPTG